MSALLSVKTAQAFSVKPGVKEILKYIKMVLVQNCSSMVHLVLFVFIV